MHLDQSPFPNLLIILWETKIKSKTKNGNKLIFHFVICLGWGQVSKELISVKAAIRGIESHHGWWESGWPLHRGLFCSRFLGCLTQNITYDFISHALLCVSFDAPIVLHLPSSDWGGTFMFLCDTLINWLISCIYDTTRTLCHRSSSLYLITLVLKTNTVSSRNDACAQVCKYTNLINMIVDFLCWTILMHLMRLEEIGTVWFPPYSWHPHRNRKILRNMLNVECAPGESNYCSDGNF